MSRWKGAVKGVRITLIKLEIKWSYRNLRKKRCLPEVLPLTILNEKGELEWDCFTDNPVGSCDSDSCSVKQTKRVGY